jgi:hypothetical protein
MIFAVTYTIKNEHRLIADAIKYYRAQGASQIFVFFDGSDDLTRSVVEENSAYVIARDSVLLSEVDDCTKWFSWIEENWDEWFDLRKMLNTYWAALEAKAKGVEWLLSIDADEILAEDFHNTLREDGLKAYFSSIPARIQQLSFLNHDVIPTQLHADSPFCSSSFFVQRPNQLVIYIWRTIRLLFSKILKSPYFSCWYDFCFYRICTLGTWPRRLVHPTTQKIIPAGIFLSYYNGKSAIRLSSINRFRPYIH